MERRWGAARGWAPALTRGGGRPDAFLHPDSPALVLPGLSPLASPLHTPVGPDQGGGSQHRHPPPLRDHGRQVTAVRVCECEAWSGFQVGCQQEAEDYPPRAESMPAVPSFLVRGLHPAPAPHRAWFLRPRRGQAPEALTDLSHTRPGSYLPVPSGTFRSFTLTPVRCLPTPGDRALWLSCPSRQHSWRSVCLVWDLLGSPPPPRPPPRSWR